jgi:RNA polymerase sigma factor (sigma-70 family)
MVTARVTRCGREMGKKEGPVDDPLERFTCLYDRYYRNVLRYALQHAEQGFAEDVASEVFLVAWRRWPKIPEPALPWLLGVARNRLRKQAGESHRQRILADLVMALTGAADMAAWDAGEHAVERASALEVLASLPARDVEALTLITWHGLDVRAAAAVAGCSPRAFTVRLHRARRRLAEALRGAEQAQRFSAHRPAAGRQRHAVPSGPPTRLISKEQI